MIFAHSFASGTQGNRFMPLLATTESGLAMNLSSVLSSHVGSEVFIALE